MYISYTKNGKSSTTDMARKKHMEGKISERRDRDGVVRWKGEMRYRSGTKVTILKFKLQIFLPPQVIADSYLARVDFVQQQGNNNFTLEFHLSMISLPSAVFVGDAMSLSDAVTTIGEILRNYELDAELISTANGWLMTQDMQQTGHQQVY